MEIPYREFILRPATNADIPSIKKVVFSVLQEYGLKGSESGKDKDLSDLDQYYFSKNGYFGVVMESSTNEIVGTFSLYRLDDASCELRKMYLLRSARGKGVGEFILKYAIGVAKEKGYSKMTLETISPLKEAISLYKKHGFSEVAPREISDRVDQAFELNLE
jgi:putative acetyltransferase